MFVLLNAFRLSLTHLNIFNDSFVESVIDQLEAFQLPQPVDKAGTSALQEEKEILDISLSVPDRIQRLADLYSSTVQHTTPIVSDYKVNFK